MSHIARCPICFAEYDGTKRETDAMAKRWTKRVRASKSHDALVLFVENAERRAKFIAGMDPSDSRIPRLLQEQRDEAVHVLQVAKEGR